MPRQKSLGHEIGCLTYPSGCGERVQISDCNWCFDGYKKDSNKTTVTPAGDDLYESDGTNDSSAEDDNLLDSEDDEISLDSCDDDSVVSFDHSESHQPPMIGNRLVNLPFLSSLLHTVTTCKQCADTDMSSFVDFCVQQTKTLCVAADEKKTYKEKYMLLKRNSNIRAWYEEWKSGHMQRHGTQTLKVNETTYGLATNVTLSCSKCGGQFPIVECRKTEKWKETKSDLCQYELNLRFCLALQLMGVGGQHAATMAAFLDLPEPAKWNRQFNRLENFTYEAVQKVKDNSQLKAAEDEILATIMEVYNKIC